MTLTANPFYEVVESIYYDIKKERFIVFLRDVTTRRPPQPFLAELKAFGWIIDGDDLQAEFPAPPTTRSSAARKSAKASGKAPASRRRVVR